VARNTLCGLFDAAEEPRADLALAGLSSDAFRRQHSSAEVTSDRQDGVRGLPRRLRCCSRCGWSQRAGPRGNQPQNDEEQAIAQLLSIDDEILVCSYLPRTTGQY